MKRLIRNAIWIVAAGLTGCASEPQTVNTSDMCAQIGHFANSSDNDHRVRWVELSADRRCTGDSSTGASQMCQFLTTTSSVDVDRERALECLHDTNVERYTSGDLTMVRYTARLAEYTDRRVLVRVEYPVGAQSKSSLKISAQRLPPLRQL